MNIPELKPKCPNCPLAFNPDAAYGYPWHSHDEREITTNNVFPGGMMMILLIDPPTAFLDETL